MKSKALTTIENSHQSKTTTIVGDVIINGCQIFHVNDLQQVCGKHKVDQLHVDQMLAVKATVSNDPKIVGKLWKHSDLNVRAAVAMQGLKHDKLMKDEYGFVRRTVANCCNEHIAKLMVNDEYWHVRYNLAQRGLCTELLLNDSDTDVLCVIARRGEHLDVLSTNESHSVRTVVAEQGYKPEVMVNDTSYAVRRAVARLGLFLDQLVNDKNEYVRIAVAEQGYGLDTLMNDSSEEVRAAVVRQGHKLEEFISDSCWYIRRNVARAGFGLDILINDPDEDVREAASNKKTQLEAVSYE